MEVTSFELEKINYSNNEHLTFLNKLMKSSNMDYLWDLADSNLDTNHLGNSYIVLKDKERIGYLNISDVTEAMNGKTVNIYYAIDQDYRGKGYGEDLVKVLSNNLFSTGKVDCIIAQVDINNEASQHILMKNGYQVFFEDEEYKQFMQTKKAHVL